jgi:hypothetical protein
MAKKSKKDWLCWRFFLTLPTIIKDVRQSLGTDTHYYLWTKIYFAHDNQRRAPVFRD